MDAKLLEEIGLTCGEAKVYLSLLRLGATKTGQLAKEAGVSSSKVYKILGRLMKKGLAGSVVRGKIQYFAPMEPRRILDYMEEKERALSEKKLIVERLIPELELEQQLAKEKTEVVVYEGLQAIMNMYRIVLDELKKGDTYFVINAGYGPGVPAVRAFFQNYHTQRAKKGIHVKMLANYDRRGNLVPATLLHSSVRYLPHYVKENMMVLFYKNKAFLFFLVKDPKGFLVKGEDVVAGFRTYFDALWEISNV